MSGLQVAYADNWRRPFGQWHYTSFVEVLYDTSRRLRTQDITIESIQRSRLDSETFQSKARALVIASCTNEQSVSNRIRQKIKRWNSTKPAAHVVRWVLDTFVTLSKYCRPAVPAAYFRALWNGWPTSYRMRTAVPKQAVKHCVFNCSNGCDRLEHYIVCPVVWRFMAASRPNGLGLDLSLRSVQNVLLLNSRYEHSIIIRMGIALYAMARTIHDATQKPYFDTSVDFVARTMRMHAYEVTEGTKARYFMTVRH